MLKISKHDPHWQHEAIEATRHLGFAVITDVLDGAFLEKTRAALYACQRQIAEALGTERLRRAGELGVLRLMMLFEPFFFEFLEIPEVLAVVDATVGPTAVLHLQNGFVLPSFPPGEAPAVFQSSFHRDFPRYLNGYMASVNAFFAVDAFTPENGATLVVPGTHQREAPPDPGYMLRHAVPLECPAGAMVVFDSTLWHAAGPNTSGHDRLAVNHQFTRSYFKQQIDYVRALGDGPILARPPRTQQLLGWYTRVVTSLDEYYRPEDGRLYRKGQG